MNMTVELFDNIINTSQDCVFWKDEKRRFLGVNQAFLDFYGFASEDVLIGKSCLNAVTRCGKSSGRCSRS